ncbi:hypothetical protein BV25DRAFT_1987825 [Artomyces pyxidatus]|uniref:Uncharacterized protein n=1 Tax=Artomyces pyxidatus TaxID=48021 RepID=A0ACB8TG47_9AGAM|nr:hypothetical protein BV25DRAFT_1987825 [Artomyces pyxidatus]
MPRPFTVSRTLEKSPKESATPSHSSWRAIRNNLRQTGRMDAAQRDPSQPRPSKSQKNKSGRHNHHRPSNPAKRPLPVRMHHRSNAHMSIPDKVLNDLESLAFALKTGAGGTNHRMGYTPYRTYAPPLTPPGPPLRSHGAQFRRIPPIRRLPIRPLPQLPVAEIWPNRLGESEENKPERRKWGGDAVDPVIPPPYNWTMLR